MTSNTLTWALLELAQAPPIQDRLRAEIRRVRGENGSKPRLEAEDIRAMPFLNAVVQVSRFIRRGRGLCRAEALTNRKSSDSITP